MSAITLSDSGEVTTDPEEQTFSVKFKDPIFEEYVVSHYDLDLDGFLSYEEAENVVALNLSGKKITDFTGIEHLVNLEILDCSSNKMTELDLRKNAKLKVLVCDQNVSLDTITLSGAVNLENLSSLNTAIRALDLRTVQKLKYLRLDSCGSLEYLKLGDASDLEEIYISSTKLKTLNLSTCRSLRILDVASCDLATLNLSACINLETLDCIANDLTALDLRNCPKVSSLDVNSNPLCILELGDNPYLTSVNLQNYYVPLQARWHPYPLLLPYLQTQCRINVLLPLHLPVDLLPEAQVHILLIHLQYQ